MTAETFTPSVGVTLTPAAIAHVRKQLASKPEARGIRLAIRKSGCSGFMYETEWVTEQGDDDAIFNFDDVDVYVARKDLPVVNGTEIDFIREGLNSMFHFRNPNATAECGCGESFSIT
ncbi:iron-sulfur cluster assembly accessory protein [Marinobacter sp. NFXS9]|uniref:HesB/IscA family protein n=1 Tax=Marinobacter sp. NFXS9 TaxID=2818433 RepID=UPI0032DE5697